MIAHSFWTKKLSSCYKLPIVVASRRLTMEASAEDKIRRQIIDKVEAVDLYHCTISSSGQSSPSPPLVLLHGLMGSMKVFKNIATLINQKSGRTVISVDARNHGHSPFVPQLTYIHMAHDTAKLINKLGLSKVTVLGHSMGGRTAMALSLLYPDLISSTIVGDINPGTTSKIMTHKLSILLDAMMEISKNVKPGITLEEARKAGDEQLKPVRENPIVRQKIMKGFIQTKSGDFKWRSNVAVLRENIDNVTKFPKELKGLQYKGPALFIAGSKSDYISRNEDMQLIQEYFPSAERVTVEGQGHALPYREPEKFSEIVCEFLGKSTLAPQDTVPVT